MLRRIANIKSIKKNDIPYIMQHLSIRENIIDWMVDWCWTYDPRNPAIGLPSNMPWVPWPRQIEFVEWFYRRYLNQESGLVEKSRDAGATWLFCLVFLREWRFEEGFAGGIGSRKLTLVDDRDNPKAVFPKIRHILYNQPKWWLPKGFDRNYDKVANMINPENGSNIAGEGGDDIGRGDRRSVYLVDESAFLEHPQMVDSALSQTTNTQFDLSTPNGMNYFGQKRHSGRVDVFTFHWKQDGRKTQEWYCAEKLRLDPTVVAQEIDIDYHASVEGLFIPPAHVQAAIELKLKADGVRSAGVDVAAGGKNQSSICIRTGCYNAVKNYDFANGVDLVHKAIEVGNEEKISFLNYDKIGVGHSFYSVVERTETIINFSHYGVLAGGRPSDNFYVEFGKKGSDIFANARAEWWYIVARKFKKTYEHVTKAAVYPLEELISIENDGELVSQLSSPKKIITESGKIRAEGKEMMLKRGIQSPDKADALVMANIPQNAGNRYVFPTAKNQTRDLKITWTPKASRETMVHYGAMVQLDDMSCWLIETLYDSISGKLYIYGCWQTENPSPALVVPVIIQRMHLREYMIRRLLVSDSIMKGKPPHKAPFYYYKQEFKKRKCNPKLSESVMYDQTGSTTIASEMFLLKKIYIDHSAKESARQLSSWTIINGKPNTEDCAYCIGLLMIISELKRIKMLVRMIKKRDYHIVRTVSR